MFYKLLLYFIIVLAKILTSYTFRPRHKETNDLTKHKHAISHILSKKSTNQNRFFPFFMNHFCQIQINMNHTILNS